MSSNIDENVNIVKLINETSFSENFKNYIKDFFSYNEHLLHYCKKRFVLDESIGGLLREIFTSVDDGSTLFIGSRGGETYMFGTLLNQEDCFEFDGLAQKSYGFKGYIYVIDTLNNAKTITSYITIREEDDTFVLTKIDDVELNAAVHHFKA